MTGRIAGWAPIVLILVAAVPSILAVEADPIGRDHISEITSIDPLPESPVTIDCPNADCILRALRAICLMKDLLQRNCGEQCDEACGPDREGVHELNCGVCSCSCE